MRATNRPRSAFTDAINGITKKTNDAPEASKAKTDIRRRVLNAIGAENAHVGDWFAGEGRMYQAAWKDAASYIGSDEFWYRDERTCYVGDSLRVLRCIDLKPFTVHDFDTWGSPWTAVLILADRRGPLEPGEKLGLVLTEGSGLRLRMGEIPDALAVISGLYRHMPGVARSHAAIIDRALNELCRRMRCRIEARWQAKGKAASGLYYIGLVLVGVEAPGEGETRPAVEQRPTPEKPDRLECAVRRGLPVP